MSSNSESVKIASTSSPSADMPTVAAAAVEKKFMNLQTQHGNEMTADEENIVVFGRSISPIRESSDVFVWHFEIDVGAKKKDEDEHDDDEDVSTAFLIPFNHYTSSSHCRWDVDVVFSGGGLSPKTSDVYRVSNYDKIENWW